MAYTPKALSDKIADDCNFVPYLNLDVKREVVVSLVNLTASYQEASINIPSQYACIYFGRVKHPAPEERKLEENQPEFYELRFYRGIYDINYCWRVVSTKFRPCVNQNGLGPPDHCSANVLNCLIPRT